MILIVLISIYATLSMATLASYPAVHSDEVWLASLTRTMFVEGSLAATEDFFSITPRYPHAIKTLYHLIQMPFIIVDYSHVSARLPSALAGIAAVWLLYSIIERLTRKPGLSGSIALAFGMDPQMLYVAHLGRQEALVVALTLTAVRVALNRSPRAPLWSGLIIGTTIFIHPNAFVAAAAVVPWIVRSPYAGFRDLPRRVGLYVFPIAIAAIAAVGFSLLMDPAFLRHYASFGESVGVSDSALRRLFRLRSFFEKAIIQNQGTYYLPPITPQLIWGGAFLVIAPIFSAMRHWSPRTRSDQIVRSRQVPLDGSTEQDESKLRSSFLLPEVLPLLSAFGIIVALFIIGKYSPPSIVFIFPFLYLSIGVSAGPLVRERRYQSVLNRIVVGTIVLVTIAISAAGTAEELGKWYTKPSNPRSYSAYRSAIEDALPTPLRAGTVVLGNLNAGFAFPPNTLRGYRDFANLPPRDPGALEDYLRREEVDFVLFPAEELELIYQTRPVWNDVYGNPTRFYPQLQAILANSAERVAVIPAPIYGMRLLRYIDEIEATVEVYRLDRERM